MLHLSLFFIMNNDGGKTELQFKPVFSKQACNESLEFHNAGCSDLLSNKIHLMIKDKILNCYIS